ncbi:MAG TPA: hypothetical protein VGA33_06600 [Thermoanaerobaculia bacterium]
MNTRELGIAIGAIALLLGTVLVFLTFDRHSHSASDTLRPFLITMIPVWSVAIAATRVLLRER